jgi:hypothetical protein
MAMSPFSSDEDDGMMSEINMTPLVDVMLVLLIIFLVTIPAINHAVKIDLPKASSPPQDPKPAPKPHKVKGLHRSDEGLFLCARRHIRASGYFGVETFESAVSPHATAVLDTDSAISPIRPTIKVAVSFRISSSLAKRFQYSARALHVQAGGD